MPEEQCVCNGPMSIKAFFIIFFIILVLISVIVILSVALAKDWNCSKKNNDDNENKND